LRLERDPGQSPFHDVKNIHAAAMPPAEFRLTARAAYRTQMVRRAVAHLKVGGARRDRTDDLLLAKQALSQLSYGPGSKSKRPTADKWWAWVDSNYRPHAYQACALTGLSYRPIMQSKRPPYENVSSCLKKEKRRRRKSRSSLKDPVRFQNRSIV
jgi:hypothetical protein